MTSIRIKESQGVYLAFLVLVVALFVVLIAVDGLKGAAVQWGLGSLYALCSASFLLLLEVGHGVVGRVRHFWHAVMSVAMLPMAFSIMSPVILPRVQLMAFSLATLWFIGLLFYQPHRREGAPADEMGVWCNAFHAVMMAAMLWMVIAMHHMPMHHAMKMPQSTATPLGFNGLGWAFFAVMVVGIVGYGRLLFLHHRTSAMAATETLLIAMMSVGMAVMLAMMLL